MVFNLGLIKERGTIMRVTNKMIMNNAASNINSTKEIVNQRNTQMTTQKKIDKPLSLIHI